MEKVCVVPCREEIKIVRQRPKRVFYCLDDIQREIMNGKFWGGKVTSFCFKKGRKSSSFSLKKGGKFLVKSGYIIFPHKYFSHPIIPPVYDSDPLGVSVDFGASWAARRTQCVNAIFSHAWNRQFSITNIGDSLKGWWWSNWKLAPIPADGSSLAMGFKWSWYVAPGSAIQFLV